MLDRYDENLILSYIEDELDGQEKAAFEQLLAADPQLATLVEQLRADRHILCAITAEQVPANLMGRVNETLERHMLLDSTASSSTNASAGTTAPPDSFRFPTWLRGTGSLAAVIAIGAALTFQFDPLGWFEQGGANENGTGLAHNDTNSQDKFGDASTSKGSNVESGQGKSNENAGNTIASTDIGRGDKSAHFGANTNHGEGEIGKNAIGNLLGADKASNATALISLRLASADPIQSRRQMVAWAESNNIQFVSAQVHAPSVSSNRIPSPRFNEGRGRTASAPGVADKSAGSSDGNSAGHSADSFAGHEKRRAAGAKENVTDATSPSRPAEDHVEDHAEAVDKAVAKKLDRPKLANKPGTSADSLAGAGADGHDADAKTPRTSNTLASKNQAGPATNNAKSGVKAKVEVGPTAGASVASDPSAGDSAGAKAPTVDATRVRKQDATAAPNRKNKSDSHAPKASPAANKPSALSPGKNDAKRQDNAGKHVEAKTDELNEASKGQLNQKEQLAKALASLKTNHDSEHDDRGTRVPAPSAAPTSDAVPTKDAQSSNAWRASKTEPDAGAFEHADVDSQTDSKTLTLLVPANRLDDLMEQLRQQGAVVTTGQATAGSNGFAIQDLADRSATIDPAADTDHSHADLHDHLHDDAHTHGRDSAVQSDAEGDANPRSEKQAAGESKSTLKKETAKPSNNARSKPRGPVEPSAPAVATTTAPGAPAPTATASSTPDAIATSKDEAKNERKATAKSDHVLITIRFKSK